MNFCTVCDNMYYINIDEVNNSIYHFCKKCGTKDDSNINNSNIIYEQTIKQDSSFKTSLSINKYTKYDPTLPRINNLPCPNVECISNTSSDVENNIVFIKYDDSNIKFLYLCCNCDKSWHN